MTFGKKNQPASPPSGKPFGRKGAGAPAGRLAPASSDKLSPEALAFLQAERARAAELPKPANDSKAAIKAPRVKAPSAGLPTYAVPANDTSAHPGKPVWGRRVVARLVDELGMWLLIFVVFSGHLSTTIAAYGDARDGSPAEAAAAIDLFGYALLFMVLQAAYNIIMEASPKQATLGKMLVGAVVTTRDGLPPSLGAVILRNTAARFAVNIVPFSGGYVMGLFNKERRCLHDMIAGTVVRKRVPGGPAVYGDVFA
jgi:uncharacterized RDD family membrane protein YckC